MNLYDLTNPTIEGSINVNKYFKVLDDDSRGMVFKRSKYTLFDFSVIFMEQSEISKTFIDVNRPIIFEDFKFS